MDPKLVDQYWNQYGKNYLSRNITRFYPETKIIPQYLVTNFSEAAIVLDLGFGTGAWFWASFLPGLVRLDGIDLHPEALEAADRVFEQGGVPGGFALVHRRLGRKFTEQDMRTLAGKRGDFFFFDYTRTWPRKIKRNHYDLVTEHGGGFGEMKGEDELSASVRHCAGVLKKGGSLLFVNFHMSTSPDFSLDEGMISRAIQNAGMKMMDFQTTSLRKNERITSSIKKMFYGYAQKK